MRVSTPPMPVMHSPPRPFTLKDHQDWNALPCISNWKNSKGYTIPLDKRLGADGRGLQDVEINQNFSKLLDALYAVEEKAREAVSMRSKLQKEIVIKEKKRKEQELRALAQKARFERSEKDNKDMIEEMREERLHSEEIREERHGERERKRRLTKRKITGGNDRDISENIALGIGYTEAGRGGEVKYDQRLFNQTKGLDSGFGSDDQYNVFDKKKLSNVQPMQDEEANPDPFELDQFMKKVKKNSLGH